MISWIVIIAAIAVVFVFTRTHDIRHMLWTGMLVVFLLTLFSFYQVSNSYGADFGSFSGIISSFKLYFSWLGSLFENFVQITGNAVKLDWLRNITNK
jgi:hypothetical protein